MVRTHLTGWTVSLVLAGVLAALFVFFGGLTYGYSPRSVICFALIGASLGFVAAPDLEPRAFRYPIAWQISFCVLGLEALALYTEAGPLWHVGAVAAGCVLGFTARYWTKHIDVSF